MSQKEKSLKKANTLKKKKSLKKPPKKFTVFLGACVSIVTLIPAVGNFYLQKQQNHRDELLLQPRFTLCRSTDEFGNTVWKVTNTGGDISNTDIYPMMYVDFFFTDETADNNGEVSVVTIQLRKYFDNGTYYYDVNDKTFYVCDTNNQQLNDFCNFFSDFRYEQGLHCEGCSTRMYLNLSYCDYTGEQIDKIYSLGDNLTDDFHDISSNYREQRLIEIDEIPPFEIGTPAVYRDPCVVVANYDRAETQQFISDLSHYRFYLYYLIMDMAKGTDDDIDDMLGCVIQIGDTVTVRSVINEDGSEEFTNGLQWDPDNAIYDSYDD